MKESFTVQVNYQRSQYKFLVFRDKASEPCGVSFHMAYAAPCSLSEDELNKPRAWICVMVAETQKGQSAESNADLEDAYFKALFDGLRSARRHGLAVSQHWHHSQTSFERCYIYPSLHKLIEDDPQQSATCACGGCVYCDQPNAIRASVSHRANKRTEANQRVMIEEALQLVEDGATPRSEAMRLARAQLKHHGLKWPPRLPSTFRVDSSQAQHDLTDSGAFWVEDYAQLHNIGLCTWPDSIQLPAQLTYIKYAGESGSEWLRLLKRADAYVLAHFSDWRILKGRCKSKGASGIFKRLKGGTGELPRVRRSSKYDNANAMRFVRVRGKH